MTLNSEKPRILVKDEKKYIFDFIRKKYVLLTPEEWVRQNTIMLLVYQKNYPKNLIRVEQKLKGRGNYFRTDVVVYDRNGSAIMIIECKSEKVKITQQTFEQISKYNFQFKVDYLMVTNGLQYYVCLLNYDDKTYHFLDEIPDYKDIIAKKQVK